MVSDDGDAPWRQAVDWRGARGFPETATGIDRRALEVMLTGLVNYAIVHQVMLSDTRSLFFFPEEMESIGRALVAGGYLERRGERVQWTDKIAPLMQAAYCRDEEGWCQSEIWAALGRKGGAGRPRVSGLPARLAHCRSTQGSFVARAHGGCSF